MKTDWPKLNSNTITPNIFLEHHFDHGFLIIGPWIPSGFMNLEKLKKGLPLQCRFIHWAFGLSAMGPRSQKDKGVATTVSMTRRLQALWVPKRTTKISQNIKEPLERDPKKLGPLGLPRPSRAAVLNLRPTEPF
ncbi:hypothetical protein TNCV_2007871 [Trichonephila clavipes]|nr:hypothetical protein TNCV_2007871 [Trichonephila clavipes]